MSDDRARLARRLIVGLAGPALAPAERRWLAHWQPAGVILFARNCEDTARWRRLIEDLRAVLPDRAELCADHEGGPVSFLQALAGRPPAARTLGRLDDGDLTHRVHRETGRRLRSLGLDRVLAPCCDVLTVAHNPVIGARSFGDRSELVCRHVQHALAGLRDGGLAGCAKHWPGHGATVVDTHDDLPAWSDAAAAAEAHTAPFDAAIAAGADWVMLGHLPPAVGRPPVTLDADAVAAARRRFGPGTILVSDDVTMGALRPGLQALGVSAGDGRDTGLVDPALLAVAWLEALAVVGCDRLLLRGIPWRALPLPDAAQGPALPPVPRPCALDATGPASPVYQEARGRAAAPVGLRCGREPVLWVDVTAGDRLGEAVTLRPRLAELWPHLQYLDAAAAREACPGQPASRLLVTSHRPLNVAQAGLIRNLTAPAGLALVAGHPSLPVDLGRQLGPAWHVDALDDLAATDFAPLGGGI